MPEWLIILLLFLAFAITHYCAYRWGNSRGYNTGYDDSRDVGNQLDAIMLRRHDAMGDNYPPFPPAA